MDADEYEADDEPVREARSDTKDGDESVTEDESEGEKPGPSSSSVPKQEEKDDDEIMSGPLAEWFKVEKDDARPAQVPEDSETENDSDFADNAGPEDGGEPDLEDWFSVQKDDVEQESNTLASTSSSVAQDEDVKMGETGDAMEYDSDLIFKHLWVSRVVTVPTVSNSVSLGVSTWTRRKTLASMECLFRRSTRRISRKGPCFEREKGVLRCSYFCCCC